MRTDVTPRRVELTIRGFVLGAIITVLFTAANVYLGLKVGLTFATSITAAVISMAILRGFKNATIWENNIVQTIASAAGTLSSIIFVLPGLIMIGYWKGFDYWTTFFICLIGGTLGVMFSVPLRRAMVVQGNLPFPEGVAAAEVLKVGSGSRDGGAPTAAAVEENKQGLIAVVLGSVASTFYALLAAMKIAAAEWAGYFGIGVGATGIGFSWSLALLGVGHLVGLSVGVAQALGLVIAWVIAVPIISQIIPSHAHDAAGIANDIWRHQVRFLGAGTIGISAIWALFKLARPVWTGVASSLAASRKLAQDGAADLPITERDLPIKTVGLISLVSIVPMAVLLYLFLGGTALASMAVPLVIVGVIYVVIAGFLVAAASGYMAGLIGASNSPVSGLAILTVLGASIILVAIGGRGNANGAALVAYSLIVTAIVLCVATISNDNLQDLKTGQLVEATPWKQQVALVFGTLCGSIVIPPVLDLLNKAYGFALLEGAGGQAALTSPLPAPQATLISTLGRGVITGNVNWNMIGIGVLVGIAVIALDEFMRMRGKLRIPPLAVGIGIYLPAGTILAVVTGAVIGHFYERAMERRPNAEYLKRIGVLVASGMIVGESLFGVILAAIIVPTGKGEPLAVVGEAFTAPANWIGAVVFIGLVAWLYRWSASRGNAQT